LNEQFKIVHDVQKKQQQIFKINEVINKSNKLNESTTRYLDKLTTSTLQKAFSGKLVN